MIYAAPGAEGATITYKAQYDNFIGGKFVAPVKGQYFDVLTPISGTVYTQAARSTAEDVELALDAAHAAADAWGKTSVAERSNILLKIADRLEANLERLAYAETVDNGKPIRETLNADIPLAVDHFRYFAGCLRSQEGSIGEIDENTMAYHIHEPLGVVGQIIPWNFPILMAAWKLAPALGAGNCVVLKPAESTPISILVLMELIADLLPAGVLNIVNGFGREAGMPLAQSKRIAKIAFTGSTSTGRVIAQQWKPVYHQFGMTVNQFVIGHPQRVVDGAYAFKVVYVACGEYEFRVCAVFRHYSHQFGNGFLVIITVTP